MRRRAFLRRALGVVAGAYTLPALPRPVDPLRSVSAQLVLHEHEEPWDYAYFKVFWISREQVENAKPGDFLKAVANKHEGFAENCRGFTEERNRIP